jgi:hypothetical protein
MISRREYENILFVSHIQIHLQLNSMLSRLISYIIYSLVKKIFNVSLQESTTFLIVINKKNIRIIASIHYIIYLYLYPLLTSILNKRK